MRSNIRIWSAICALAFSSTAWGEWKLDDSQSRLSFISVKATDIAEVHQFTKLKGKLAADGQLEILIDLLSVETLIPIRNERMEQFLFNTEQFPIATVTAQIDPGSLRGLGYGQVQMLTTEGNLSLKEKNIAFSTEVLAAKVGDDTLVVTTAQPILMTASSLGLTEGVEKLRELAGLSNISQAVPVTFVMTFKEDSQP